MTLDKRTTHYHRTKKVMIQWSIVLILLIAVVYMAQPVSTPVSPCPETGCVLPTVPVVKAAEPVETPKPKSKVPANPHQGAVDQYSKEYSVSPELMNCILFKESSYNPSAKNKNSSATGMAQFIKSTWTSFRTRMGEDTNLDLRLDARESIKTLAWALSKGYKNHWEVVTNGSCK
jgi:hypothetical protein